MRKNIEQQGFISGRLFGRYHICLGGNMDIDIILKVGAIGIVVAVFNQILTKTGRDEQAMFVTLAGVIVVMALIVSMMNDLFTEVKSVFNLY